MKSYVLVVCHHLNTNSEIYGDMIQYERALIGGHKDVKIALRNKLKELGVERCSLLTEKYWRQRGWSQTDSKIMSVRSGKRNPEYYEHRGLSKQEAAQEAENYRKVADQKNRDGQNRRYSSMSEYDKKSILKSNKEYWESKGFNTSQSIYKARQFYLSEVRPNHKKYLDDRTPDFLRENSNRCIEYWLARYPEEEAKRRYKDRQATFSLDKCIEKHGEEKGREVWQERQDKWQASLESRPQEEIDRTNKLKGLDKQGNPQVGMLYNERFFAILKNQILTGYLYYVRFTYIKTGKVLYKIGISNDYKRRLDHWIGKKDLIGDIIHVCGGLLKDCYELEQSVLNTHRDIRTRDDDLICSTELFEENVLYEIKNQNKKLEDVVVL